MAQPPKKQSFVPSELDRRRASEFKRRAKEIGQPALAKIIGVSVRTIQRYIKLERSMDAQDVDAFVARFGPIDFPSRPQPDGDGHADSDAARERVILRHEGELTYGQVRTMRAIKPVLSEQEWEQVASAMLSGRAISP